MKKAWIFVAAGLLLCAGCTAKGKTPPSISPIKTTAVVPTSTSTAPTPTPELPRIWRDDPLPDAALSALDLPVDGRVWDWMSGDLNGDGLEDLATVIESPADEQDENSVDVRILSILLKTQGGYQLGQQNDRLISRRNEGGGWGDPYDGMFLDEEGKLHICEYGGGWNRWRKDYRFTWSGSGLVLVSFSFEVNYPTIEDTDIHVREDIYDYECQTYERWIDDGVLLFQCDMESEVRPLEEVLGYDDPSFWEAPAPYLPELYSMEFFEGPGPARPPAMTATTALEQAREQLDVPLERVEIPWTEETYQNYSDRLGYAPPRYYYTSGAGILYYNSLTYGNGDYEHEIGYRSLDCGEYKRCTVIDGISEGCFE